MKINFLKNNLNAIYKKLNNLIISQIKKFFYYLVGINIMINELSKIFMNEFSIKYIEDGIAL